MSTTSFLYDDILIGVWDDTNLCLKASYTFPSSKGVKDLIDTIVSTSLQYSLYDFLFIRELF